MPLLVSSCVAVISMGVFTFVWPRTAVHALVSGGLQFTSTLHVIESIVMQPKYYYIGLRTGPSIIKADPFHIAKSFLKTNNSLSQEIPRLEALESHCEPVKSSSHIPIYCFCSDIVLQSTFASPIFFCFSFGVLTKLPYSVPILPCLLHTPLSRIL